jgi:hypothetical protein
MNAGLSRKNRGLKKLIIILALRFTPEFCVRPPPNFDPDSRQQNQSQTRPMGPFFAFGKPRAKVKSSATKAAPASLRCASAEWLGVIHPALKKEHIMSFLSMQDLSAPATVKVYTPEPQMAPGRHTIKVKVAKVRPSSTGATEQLSLRLINAQGHGCWANFGLSGGNPEYRTRENARLKALLVAVGKTELSGPEELRGLEAEVLIVSNGDPVFIAKAPEPPAKPKAKAKAKAKA